MRVGTESQDIREMKRLLQYANYQKVADALNVKRASVSDWSRGNNVSPRRVEQVRELMLQSVGRRKRAAAPDVPERLDEIEAKIDAISGGLAPLARLEQATETIAELERLLRPRVGVLRGETDGSDPDEEEPPDQGSV